jgi:protein O-GlcNAcase/histone acetyltransferase
MLEQGLGGKNYLPTIGRELFQEINVFWTGPEIVSHQITLAHVREVEGMLCRKPIIWDNLHANDYDGRRFFCGPYAGRPPELRGAVRGLLSNPNNEFPLNYVPLRTLAEFVRCDTNWDSREAYLAAMREWLPHFATIHGPAIFDDLVLFGDCYYLPHEEGPEAETLFQDTRALLTEPSQGTSAETSALLHRAKRLREFCIRLVDLHDRRLFYALSRRIWELREELDLLQHYVEFKSREAQPGASFGSASHLPGTYRGGLVARLQQLLIQKDDGTFTPARGEQARRTIAQPAPSLP